MHLSSDAVLAIHEEVLKAHGGGAGLRDKALLLSAVSAPQATFGGSPIMTDLVEVAAAYLYYLCNNHPFVDGNKRTAFVVCQTFLALNGLELPCPKEEQYLTFLRLAEGNLEESQLGHWIRENSCVSSAE